MGVGIDWTAEDQPPAIIGREGLLAEIKRRLISPGETVVGVLGMGGVGKTAVMRNTASVFARMGGFESVIYVEIPTPEFSEWQKPSQVFDPGEVLGAIGRGLGLEGDCDAWSVERALSARESYLLLLDNVWCKFDLREIGVPRLMAASRRKVVVATRLLAVCTHFGARRPVRVGTLGEDEAWRLFQMSLDREKSRELSNRPTIRPYTEHIISSCGGLPLALVTLGKAMSSLSLEEAWVHTAETFCFFPSEIEGVADVVFKALKHSFYNLDLASQCCFLCCLLFPNQIDAECLAAYMCDTGMLGGEIGDGKLELARKRIELSGLINKLVDACLLDRSDFSEDELTMHDVVRGMAFSLVHKIFLVQNPLLRRQSSHRYCPIEKDTWKMLERVSIMHDSDVVLPPINWTCDKLCMFLARNNSKIQDVPRSFFKCVPNLRVLDLSGTSIEQVSTEIGRLRMLHYLDLSETHICTLPVEVGHLKNLRHIILRSTRALTTIPCGAICSLTKLRVLDTFRSGYVIWDSVDNNPFYRNNRSGVNFHDLNKLPLLEDVGLTIDETSILQKFLHWDFYKLNHSTMHLCLRGLNDLTSKLLLAASVHLKNLKELDIISCSHLSDLTFIESQWAQLNSLKLVDLPLLQIRWKLFPESVCPKIQVLVISGCHAMLNIDWVQHLKWLKKMSLYDCKGLEELITGDEDLISLKELSLGNLPNLRTFFRGLGSFPSLDILTIGECPMLKSFPSTSGNLTKVRVSYRSAIEWKAI